MKTTKTFSLDIEVLIELDKRNLGSEFVNAVLRKALGLK